MSGVDGRELCAIFAGGMAGALARVGISELFPSAAGAWPWAVFAINVAGAFILGYVVVLLRGRPSASTYWRAFAATGFCGAFTTFSTMQLELLEMLRAGHWPLAVAYACASVICGYAAFLLALGLTRRARVMV